MNLSFATRRWVLAPVGTVLALLLLVGTSNLALRLRAKSDPGDLPNAASLDYGTSVLGTFSPLSASFIRHVFGGVIDTPAAGIQGSRRLRSAPTPRADFGGRRVVVRHAFTNDNRANAILIPRVPYTARSDTRSATRESGESAACGQLGGGTVWYRYRPPATVGLIANTFGSDYSTTLGVFGGGTTIGCDTDVSGNALVQFVARKGVTYDFQIAGPARGGDLVFNLDPEGVTHLVSASRRGEPGDAASNSASISGDGRFVAFESNAENLVSSKTYEGEDISSGDLSGYDVFVADRARHTLQAVSVAPSGGPANGESGVAFMSGNGRYVAFESLASNLVKGDTNGAADVFVRDLVTHRTELVSVTSSGAQQQLDPVAKLEDPSRLGCSCYMFPTLSYDGRYVAFSSSASNLVAGDHNNAVDVFVRDRKKGRTERVSVDSSGREQETNAGDSSENARFLNPSISGDGRFVSFRSSAGNLARDDNNRSYDMFVHDRVTRTTERITSAPGPANVEDDDQPYYVQPDPGVSKALSFDGRYVAFSASPLPTVGPSEVHIFVYDRKTGRTKQVDVSSSGQRGEYGPGDSARSPAVSADGRYVAFLSAASNLVAGDENGATDVFVHDQKTATTIRLTGAPAAGEGPCEDCGSSRPSISADGSIVAFESTLVNAALAPDSAVDQIFVNARSL